MKLGHLSKEDSKPETSKPTSINNNGFFTCKWLTGFSFLLLGCTIHVCVLPFADLTLLTANSATALIVSACLSITCLGEAFIWRYDLTAMILIVTGSALIIVQSSTTQKTFEA